MNQIMPTIPQSLPPIVQEAIARDRVRKAKKIFSEIYPEGTYE